MGAAVGDHKTHGYETCIEFAGDFTPIANPPVGAIAPLTVPFDSIVKPKGDVTNPCNLACEPDGRIQLSHSNPNETTCKCFHPVGGSSSMTIGTYQIN